MRYFKVCAILTLALSMIQISCSSKNRADFSGGDCSYIKFEGYARIKSITTAPASEHNCPDKPKQITFEFTPVKISDRQKYRFTNFSDSAVNMHINDGANPSLAWIKANRIEVGKKFRCFRTEISKGTCTPVIFTFPELDLFPAAGCK